MVREYWVGGIVMRYVETKRYSGGSGKVERVKLAQAIARMEGWGLSEQNRPTRNNNPGNVEYGEFARQHGADRVEDGVARPRYAHFPTAEAGWECLRRLLRDKYVGMTLKDAINKYAPPSENDTVNYVELVSRWTGIEPGAVITREMV